MKGCPLLSTTFILQNLALKCELKMDKIVVEKCLAFCQALSETNQLFSLSLNIGSDTFNFDLKELVKSSCVKKKKSPSQLRREKRRREERKPAATEDAAEVSEKSAEKPKCDPCEATFNSEEESSVHIDTAHKKLSSPEKERGIESHCELQLSPTHVKRDEKRLSEQECPSSPAPVGTSPPPSATTICDLPLKCRGGAKCFEIWSRDHGLAKCGKSFQNENDLIVHAKNNHNYCLEHERMWYKCLPCKLREMDDNSL